MYPARPLQSQLRLPISSSRDYCDSVHGCLRIRVRIIYNRGMHTPRPVISNRPAPSQDDKPLAQFVQDALKPKRGRCLYDGKLFPKTKASRKFCNDQCRYRYNKFQSASRAHAAIMKGVRQELDEFRKAVAQEVLREVTKAVTESMYSEVRKRMAERSSV
jgi:hypothetical protein